MGKGRSNFNGLASPGGVGGECIIINFFFRHEGVNCAQLIVFREIAFSFQVTVHLNSLWLEE